AVPPQVALCDRGMILRPVGARAPTGFPCSASPAFQPATEPACRALPDRQLPPLGVSAPDLFLGGDVCRHSSAEAPTLGGDAVRQGHAPAGLHGARLSALRGGCCAGEISRAAVLPAAPDPGNLCRRG